ncbi:hypothetical protein [Mesotoga prima]|uniref:hypothetical protein n=1 Tax=Mesotoga prima TaxID=1184387 RepID=UPI002FDB91F5
MMFFKKINDRRRENRITKIERRIPKSREEEKGRFLYELWNLKREKGDNEGAMKAALERLAFLKDPESFEDLISTFEKIDGSSKNSFAREIEKFACEFDRGLWEEFISVFFEDQPEAAIKFALSCYRISSKALFAEIALKKLENAVYNEEPDRLVRLREMYISTISEVGEISRVEQLRLLERALDSSKSLIQDEQLLSNLAVKYIDLMLSSEDLDGIAKKLSDCFDRFVVYFKGNEVTLLDKLDLILPKIQEEEIKRALIEKLRILGQSISDKRYDSDFSGESDYLEFLKKSIANYEFKARKRDSGEELLRKLACDYERIIDILESPEEKLLYIRKLGALLRDRLEEPYKALEVFEEGLRLKADDISLWLVKGMTLEKIARNESDPVKASICWKRTYDHYHAIAETFEEQEVKLTAIEKCATIQAERLTGV